MLHVIVHGRVLDVCILYTVYMVILYSLIYDHPSSVSGRNTSFAVITHAVWEITVSPLRGVADVALVIYVHVQNTICHIRVVLYVCVCVTFVYVILKYTHNPYTNAHIDCIIVCACSVLCINIFVSLTPRSSSQYP